MEENKKYPECCSEPIQIIHTLFGRIRVWDIWCAKKDINRRYRVIGIKQDRVFLCFLGKNKVSLIFNMRIKDFRKNFKKEIKIQNYR